jgi:hypothetical protein
LTKGDAVTHKTRSSKRAVHFRRLAVASISIRNGAADFIGVVGLACATISGWFAVVRRTTLWHSARVTLAPVPGLLFLGSVGGLHGAVIERLCAEHLSNKVPRFFPSFAGGNMLCSRLRTGGNGSGRQTKSRDCWTLLVGAVGIEPTTSPV